MTPKVKKKVANWNQKGPTLSQRATKMQNKTRTIKSRPPEDEQIWFWAPLGRFGAGFGRPLDFEGFTKSSIFV